MLAGGRTCITIVIADNEVIWPAQKCFNQAAGLEDIH